MTRIEFEFFWNMLLTPGLAVAEFCVFLKVFIPKGIDNKTIR